MEKLALITSCIFKRAHAAAGEESSILWESREKDGDVGRFAAAGGGGATVARRDRSFVAKEVAACVAWLAP